ncbi:cytochrome P450 [Catellatospora sp. TT07R-123]|uniref:cytochrome P450 n=1 Tax=Catellatospora sp. TT07R-123 TaxID=2733863 RepID=UPI001AFDE086|nr:cytochrome P450 [Catellatospora sp. TT07R-123]GHJ44483.1 cytochrome P450 [Catellatospora sp. TT07R-123]
MSSTARSAPPVGPGLLPLLARLRDRDGDVFTVPGAGLHVADPALAKAVLANAGGDFAEHSDFFATATGFLAPRQAQQRIAREARDLLAAYTAAHAADLPRLVGTHLAPGAAMPDAANRLLHEHLGPALLGPATAPAVRAVVAEVVTHAVLAGARQRRGRLRRALLRHRAYAALAAETTRRRADPAHDPADLLDVVALALPDGYDPADAVDVFLSLLFATVGSTGFLLSWTLYLVGRHPDQAGAPPAALVREALRLWPVAWLFGRPVARAHDLGPVRVEPGQTVHVCAYLAHRHPGHWPEPDGFRPDRWRDGPHGAFLPFGFGAHACTGAAVATGLAADVVALVLASYDVAVLDDGGQPQVGPALAPPPHRVRLTPRSGERR